MHHIIPLGGTEPQHEAADSCWCFPTYHPDHTNLVLHNAKDARDVKEKRDPELKWTLIREKAKATTQS